MGHDVEFEIRSIDPVALLELRDHVGALLEDELVEPPRVLHVVAPPVVWKLEAREVSGTVVELAHASERLVTIASHAEGPQDVEVGLRFDREPEEPDPDAIEGARRLDGVTEIAKRAALGHRQRYKASAVRPARVRVRAREGAPDHATGLAVLELRAADARDHDHWIPGRVTRLGGAVVEAPEVRSGRDAGGAARDGEYAGQ